MARCGGGYSCFYCGLPVRFGGDPRHPGHGTVQHVAPAAPRQDADGLPDLRLLHRFCHRALQRGAAAVPGCDLTLRRAWLGWATGQYDGGRKGDPRRFDRLGLRSGKLRSQELFRKHWRIRKLRCAALACRYYAQSH